MAVGFVSSARDSPNSPEASEASSTSRTSLLACLLTCNHPHSFAYKEPHSSQRLRSQAEPSINLTSKWINITLAHTGLRREEVHQEHGTG